MTQEKGITWSSRLGIGLGANDSTPRKICYGEKFLEWKKRLRSAKDCNGRRRRG